MHGLRTIKKINNPNKLHDWQVRNVQDKATVLAWIKIVGFTLALFSLFAFGFTLA